MRRLIIIRPEPGASASLTAARDAGLDAVAIPLFAVRGLAWTAPDPERFDAIVMTSANAARFGGDQLSRLTSLPVHAVGPATATAASDAGLAIASVGEGNGGDLLAMLSGKPRLLHLAGRHHRPLPVAESVAVYESAALPAPNGLDSILGGVVAVHSPRAGQRLADLIDARDTIGIAAISAAAAEACGTGWEAIAIADRPTDTALLVVAARLCNKSGS